MKKLELVQQDRQTYHLQLAAGGRILLKLGRRGDRESLREGFSKLSGKARRSRFLTNLRQLSESDLTYLSNIDNVDHLAWGAWDLQRAGMGVGVGRYIRLPQEPQVAELAITVLDEYQRKGIGTALLLLLAHSARPHGITCFRGYFDRENHAIQALLKTYGAQITRSFGRLWRAELALEGPWLAQLP